MNIVPEVCMEYTKVLHSVKLEMFIVFALGVLAELLSRSGK
jgi:hypothetical protein